MFSRNRPDRDDRRQIGSILSGRGSRVEFWCGMAGVLIASRIFAMGHAPYLGSVSALFTFLQIRRLHDFGATGWWVTLPITAGVLLVWLASMTHLPGAHGLAIAAALLIGVVMVLFVGAMPGDREPNRFGQPPVVFRRKAPPAE